MTTSEAEPAVHASSSQRSAPAASSSSVHEASTSWWTRPWALYLAEAVLASVVTVFMLRLWGATWTVPFFYTGDAVSSGAHVKTTLERGWYEYQPELGAPYGQMFHDFPFSDNLHLLLVKGFAPFTQSWPVAFNAYYVLSFVACALAALWFLRREGVSRSLALVLAALFAVAPYHFWRNEFHFFLAAYWPVPLALVVVMSALRGEPLWSAAGGQNFPRRLLTARGTGFAVILVVVGGATAYYAVFTGVLLAFAGLIALVRGRSWRRLCGVIAAQAVLIVTFFLNLLPDLLYARENGPNSGALVRGPDGGEVWAFKLTSLLLPASGHPISAWADFRAQYDATHPISSEAPALGLICALALVVVFGIAFLRIAHRAERPGSVETLKRRAAVADLSLMAVFTFLVGTVGGVGAVVSFVSDAIRGWNRTSIFLSLLLLAVVGLLVDGGVVRLQSRMPAQRTRWVNRLLAPAAAALLLVVGVADQQVGGSVPPYAQSAAMWDSDDAFVRQIEGTVPAGSMMFQLPYIAFPESGMVNDAGDADLLKPSLHGTSLEWSLGGIKGRPQTDWAGLVAKRPPAEVVDIITRMGFTAIVVDRVATDDHGAAVEAAYAPYTGPPAFTSPDGRWVYLSLAQQLQDVDGRMTPQERQSFTDRVLAGQP
jgi:phosphoglycerol transferase